MVIEQWGFFSVPRASPTCFNDLGLLWLGFEHPTFRLRRANTLTNYTTAATQLLIKK